MGEQMNEQMDKLYASVAAESEGIISFAVKVVLGAILVFITFKIISLISHKLINHFFSSDKSKQFRKWSTLILEKGLKTLVILIYLGYLGIPMSSILVILAIFIGLILIGLQNTISNLGSGVWIMLTKPFQIDSIVKFKEIEGTVTAISLYQTTILTWEKKVVNVPNSLVTSDYIINYNARMTRRVDIDIFLSYNNDLDQVQKILLKSVDEYKDYEILDDPKPEVIVKEFEKQLVKLQVRVHVKTIDVGNVKNYLSFVLNRELRKNDVKFGYDQKTFEEG